MKLKASNGRRLTQELFYEFNNPDAPYTLRNEDHTAKSGKTYTSVYQIYMNSADEFDAAMKIVGSMDHWRLLTESNDWFMNGKDMGGYKLDGLKQWREDMRMRDESLAKSQLLDEAQSGNVTAMKYLHEQSTKLSKGRPTTKVTKPKKSTTVSSIQDAFKKASS